MIRCSKMVNNIVKILLLLMPFHYILCECFLKNKSIDNLWRDMLIIAILVLIMIAHSGKLRLGRYGKYIILMNLIVIVFTLFSPNISIAINIARTYLITSWIYFGIVNLNLDKKKIDKWKYIIIISAVVVSVYGLFQAFILGDQFLVKIGYPSENGFLTSSYYINNFFGHQRVTGSLVSPNICGIFLAIALLTLLSYDGVGSKKKIIFALIIAVALMCTLSRSSILAFIISYIYYNFLKKNNTINKEKNKNSILKRKNKKIIVVLSVTAYLIMLLYIDSKYLGGLVSKMLKSSSKMNDLSALKHFEDLYSPIKTVIENPFGLGFGNNGPKAFAVNSKANLVESSIYMIMYDFGPFFGILFYLPFLCIFCDSICKRNRTEVQFAGSLSLLMLISYALLPNIQEFEPTFYFYFFLGLASCSMNENII